MVLKAIQDFGDGLKAAFAPFLGELDLTAIEPGEPLDVPTAWDRKEAREKQRAMEQATAPASGSTKPVKVHGPHRKGPVGGGGSGVGRGRRIDDEA